MNRRRIGAVIAAAALALTACGGDTVAPIAPAPRDTVKIGPPPFVPPNPALVYLNMVLDTIAANSIRKLEIDWAVFRAEALNGVRSTYSTSADVYPIIRTAVLKLGDHHSSFTTPAAVAASTSTSQTQLASDPLGSAITDRVKYVLVPAVSGAASDRYADMLHTVVESLDDARTCGWIVDLRANSGGNMWPMISGIGAILGEGDSLGYFMYPDSTRSAWYYRHGVSGVVNSFGRLVAQPLGRAPYVTRQQGLPVAVLQDRGTASSGEAVLVAFLGRDNVRTFGLPSFGVPTANRGFTFPDGAFLNLTVGADGDRQSRMYRDVIPPQELIPSGNGPTSDRSDPAIMAATKWLEAQSACRE